MLEPFPEGRQLNLLFVDAAFLECFNIISKRCPAPFKCLFYGLSEIGAIDTGTEGLSKYTMVPFTEELNDFKGKRVRYNLAERKVSGRLHKPKRMTITDTVKKRSYTEEVTIEMGSARDEAAQKKALARTGIRGFGPNSGQPKVRFEELIPEETKQRQLAGKRIGWYLTPLRLKRSWRCTPTGCANRRRNTCSSRTGSAPTRIGG